MTPGVRLRGRVATRLMRTAGWPLPMPLLSRAHRAATLALGVGSAALPVRESGEAQVLHRLASRWRARGQITVLDVGAYTGDYALAARSTLGPKAEIHCFEPQSEAFKILERRTARDPRITCHRIALSRAPGTAEFFLAGGASPLASLYREAVALAGVEQAGVEQVQLESLDRLARDLGLDQVDLLKLDVEGHEIEVLRGACELLAAGRIEAVQFEFGERSLASRTYLRDFWGLLGSDFQFYRVTPRGPVPIEYRPTDEIFTLETNYLGLAGPSGGFEQADRSYSGPGTDFKPGRSPREFQDVLVNHEGLVFRRGAIRRVSFARDLDAARFKRPLPYAAFVVRNYGLRSAENVVPEALWVVDNLSPRSYFHWTTECLPRLLSAEKTVPQISVLLLPRYFRRDAYVEFSLGALPTIRTVGWVGNRSNVRVGRLTCPSTGVRPGEYDAVLVKQVAARLRHLTSASETGTGRLYLSRHGATRRRIRNEKDVVRVLKSHGFRTLSVDEADPALQIRAVSAAQYLVGVHGAALTNLIFLPSGGSLLELRHPQNEVFFDCYRPLASVMGVRYLSQLCDVIPDRRELSRPGEVNRADLLVDLDLLRENLRILVEAPVPAERASSRESNG